MTENTRQAFEAWYADNGGPMRMRESYPGHVVEGYEEEAAWEAWTASRKAALEEAAKLATQSQAGDSRREPRGITAGRVAAAIRAEIDK